MTRRLEGKVALVTGGTAGIGEGTVLRLAEEGASVVFTGSNRELAANVAAASGGFFVPHYVDDVPGWKTVAETIRSRFGRLDVVFANAAPIRAMATSRSFRSRPGTRLSPSTSPVRCSPVSTASRS